MYNAITGAIRRSQLTYPTMPYRFDERNKKKTNGFVKATRTDHDRGKCSLELPIDQRQWIQYGAKQLAHTALAFRSFDFA